MPTASWDLSADEIQIRSFAARLDTRDRNTCNSPSDHFGQAVSMSRHLGLAVPDRLANFEPLELRVPKIERLIVACPAMRGTESL